MQIAAGITTNALQTERIPDRIRHRPILDLARKIAHRKLGIASSKGDVVSAIFATFKSEAGRAGIRARFPGALKSLDPRLRGDDGN